MGYTKKQIELLFERLTSHLYDNGIIILILMSVLIIFLSSKVVDITIDTSTEEILHKSDPARVNYDKFKHQFGDSSVSIIMIESNSIFSKSFLKKLKRLHKDIEKTVPHIDEVTSLLNVRNTWGEGNILHVEELLKGWPEKAYDLNKTRKTAYEKEVYRNYILSDDKKSTAIFIETKSFIPNKASSEISVDNFEGDKEDFSPASGGTTNFSDSHALTPKENAEIFDAINSLIPDYQSEDFKLSFTGRAAIVDVFNRTTDRDMKKFTILTTLVIVLSLVLLFRRISGVFLPLLIVNTSMFSTLGIMVLSGASISMMTTVIPAFLTAVGIADSIHILAIFYKKFDSGVNKKDAICFSMGHSGLAIVMTSLTTAAGLLSFSLAEITTIADMGIYAAGGVMLALLYTIILLPVFIRVLPLKQKQLKKSDKNNVLMDKILLFFADLSAKYPRKIIIISLILLIISIGLIFQLRFSSNIINYFPDNHPCKISLKKIENSYGGTISAEVILDTGRENGIYDPGFLKSLEKMESEVKAVKIPGIYIGKIISINEIIKETNQALHNNDPSFYRIPDDKKTIEQELMLFENSGSNDLEKITNTIFSKTRFTITTKWTDAVIYEKFIKEIELSFSKEFPKNIDIVVTGIPALLGRTIPAALKSMANSYIIAFIIISILMIILVGDLKFGVLSMYPNLLPIIIVMASIRLCGINLDINTLFIGSIAIGLVVDDTIHFMYNFKKYLNETDDPEASVRKTLLSTGRAMLISSVVLSANFFILVTAELNHSIRFGFFTGLVIILALLADFLVAPAIMMTVTGKIKSELDTMQLISNEAAG